MKNYICLLLMFSASAMFAQVELERDIIATSGGVATTVGDIDYSYTIGEMVATSTESNALIVCLGFQQADQTITSVSPPELPFDISVFPNPSSERIFITASTEESFDIQLIDITGKILQEYNLLLSSSPSEISLYQIPAGTYVLHFVNDKHSAFSYKIQKNQ